MKPADDSNALKHLQEAGILVPPASPPLAPDFFRNRPQTHEELADDQSLTAAVLQDRQKRETSVAKTLEVLRPLLLVEDGEFEAESRTSRPLPENFMSEDSPSA